MAEATEPTLAEFILTRKTDGSTTRTVAVGHDTLAPLQEKYNTPLFNAAKQHGEVFAHLPTEVGGKKGSVFTLIVHDKDEPHQVHGCAPKNLKDFLQLLPEDSTPKDKKATKIALRTLRKLGEEKFAVIKEDEKGNVTLHKGDLKNPEKELELMKPGMGNGAKAAIVVAAVAIIGGAIAWMRHRSKVKAEREMEHVNVAAQSPRTEKEHGAALG